MFDHHIANPPKQATEFHIKLFYDLHKHLRLPGGVGDLCLVLCCLEAGWSGLSPPAFFENISGKQEIYAHKDYIFI